MPLPVAARMVAELVTLLFCVSNTTPPLNNVTLLTLLSISPSPVAVACKVPPFRFSVPEPVDAGAQLQGARIQIQHAGGSAQG